jgi:hypothetical protein
MAAKKQPKAPQKRVYCDARHYVAKAEAAFAKCDDVNGGWYLLEGLWRFLFAHCVYWKCVPYEVTYYSAGRGEKRCVESMLREQAAMRRALVRSGGITSQSFAKIFAAMASTAASCVRGTLKDDRYLDGNVAYFAGLCDCQNGEGGDIRQPKSTYKGDWTIRDGRKRVRKSARGRSAAAVKAVQPKAGGRV